VKTGIAAILFLSLVSSASAGNVKGNCGIRFLGASTMHDFTGTVHCQPFTVSFVEAGHGGVKAGIKYEPLLDGAKDQMVRSAFVPSEEWPQGEVRLLRRGGTVVMQTVLFSKFLKLVVAEIRRKELAAWPRKSEGYADSHRYIDALSEANGRIQRQFRERVTRSDRRQTLLIEFILSGNAALVALYEPQIEEEEGHYVVASKHPITVLELSRAYVRGDIYEIAQDALGLTRVEAKKLLEPMLPPEPAGSEAQPEQEGN
jgi:hypothetical protein